MASRRSHAPTHSRNANQLRVPRGHVFIRNPLQAPKERSCGITSTPSLGSAKRDDYHPKHHTGCISPPSGNYMWWRYRTYPQLRCFAACSGFHDIGPAPRNPQLKLNLLVVRGCVTMARRHSLLQFVTPPIQQFVNSMLPRPSDIYSFVVCITISCNTNPS